MADVYSIITEKILAALEQGNVPWRKPWSATGGIPRNAVSSRPYSGINAILLSLTPYTDQRWLNFKQVSELGGKVRKGEKSSLVVFWKQQQVTDEEGEGSTMSIPLLRYYNVFNVEQCEGLKLAPVTLNTIDPLAEAEAIVAAMPNPPSIDHIGGNSAHYVPALDSIHLPPKVAFSGSEEYYSTLFHELSHSTGHPKRLTRKELETIAPFGSETYSKEELVAEFGAAFLCAQAGIDNSTLDNSATYIQSWLKVLRNDKRLAITAASQGQKAADYILGRES